MLHKPFSAALGSGFFCHKTEIFNALILKFFGEQTTTGSNETIMTNPLQIPGRKNLIASVAAATIVLTGLSAHAAGDLEKEDLKFGFIKLTDMAPLAIAYEKGYFEEEGLYVTLEAQANWKVLLDRTIDGELDGAHMLAGQPLGATIGFGTQAHIVTASVWI